MADLSDVTNTLALLATKVLYPAGLSQPSVAGVTVTTASGAPEPKALDNIIAAGNAMLTVFPMDGEETNTTRFAACMTPLSAIPAAQLSLTVVGNQILVGGTIKAGEAATAHVNYKATSYAVQANDTTATIAAAMASQIAGATANATVITILNAFDITVRVSVPVPMQAEIARQRRVFLITAWCPTPVVRDLICSAVDLSFKTTKRIVLTDDTWARLMYRGTLETDYLAKQRIYRRELRYEVEYASTATDTSYTVADFSFAIAPTAGSLKNISI